MNGTLSFDIITAIDLDGWLVGGASDLQVGRQAESITVNGRTEAVAVPVDI